MNVSDDLIAVVQHNIDQALAEDIGSGDLTALLVPELQTVTASVVCREDAIMCGADWFTCCFKTLSPDTTIRWFVRDGDKLAAQQIICEVKGKTCMLLTAERTALNFLQTLSAVATQTRQYVEAVAGTGAVIVDTRKTLPGLRVAQKYAVQCGGGVNHRTGLYDGILIKENHIAAAGGITQVLKQSRAMASENVFVQIEVESVVQLKAALDAGAPMVLLDNFPVDQLKEAVTISRNHDQESGLKTVLEASGNVSLANVRQIAETGVQRISVGSLTKNIRAVDLSMRFVS